MGATALGITEQEDAEQGRDEQHRVDGVIPGLAALTGGLGRRVLGADEPPCRPILGTRGDAGTPAGTTAGARPAAASGGTTVAAAAAETPSRGGRALRARAGAAPRVCRAASSAGQRTWSHGWAGR
jgi:hypothetical protein